MPNMDIFTIRLFMGLPILYLYITDVRSETRKTFSEGSSGKLTCSISSSQLASWEDKTNSIRIFSMDSGRNVIKTPVANNNPKYDYYTAELKDNTQFNLEIDPVQLSDIGTFSCEDLVISLPIVEYAVDVEVPPSNISVSCASSSRDCPGPNEDVSSEVTCTCIATGAYPHTLQMSWSGATPTTSVPNINPSSTGIAGSFDFSQSATESINGPKGSTQCTLEGYVNDIEEDIRSATYSYVSPTCELTAEYDESCTGSTANLTCSCAGSPKVELYTFFDVEFVVIDGDSLNNARLNVDIESNKETKFYCRGCNGFNNGDQSLSEVTICGSATITLQPATAETTRGVSDVTESSTDENTGVTDVTESTTDENTDNTKSSEPVLIAICSVEGVVIIVMGAVFFILFMMKKRGPKEGEARRHRASLHDASERKNPAYMDLQETKQLSSHHMNLDVPFENLNLQLAFSGKGLMDYHKAEVILASKKEDVVVKKVSDKASVRLANLHADEVQKLSTLKTNLNVVQFLGRCNKVPNLLCFEFVNGTKLSEYIRGNFQASKSHQYGNTKQKRYHVPERGSVEKLPMIVLQVVRGMKFLTNQKFVHPGLRSEKVIIDVSGQCKLYDFVSQENADEIVAILWSQSVPYQWMPPEYLFLEKLGPSVDVWSFGVLIWEIFSYGAIPHAGKDRNAVEKELRGKEHLPLPSNCPGAIWQIALNCWDNSPEKRPSFEHLAIQLSHMCNENKEYDQIQ